MSSRIHNEQKPFKVTFSNDLYQKNRNLPFVTKSLPNKKQTTLEKYFINPKLTSKHNSVITPVTVLVNWKICYYSSTIDDRLEKNHYIDGDLLCGKGWVTSDIISIRCKSCYLEVLTNSGSKYNLYLYDSYSNVNDNTSKFNTLYLGV